MRQRRKKSRGKALGALFLVCVLAGSWLAVVSEGTQDAGETPSDKEASQQVSVEVPFLPSVAVSSSTISRGGAYSRDQVPAADDFAEGNPWLENMVKMALPGVAAADPELPVSEPAETEPQAPESPEPAPPIEEEKEEPLVAVVDSQEPKDPLVLIYHTHATESYQPYEEGNFHIVSEEGTVRDAGNILAAALEAKGIPVLHDKTLHDNPSYNQSYSRSLETLNVCLAEHPSIIAVIDLHRDAAAYQGNDPKTFTAPDGTAAAQYSLVIGTKNENRDQLMSFAERVNSAAENKYPGFARGIIKKDYKFNQYKMDQYILLELGNNQNTIEQVRASAQYFADVMAEVLKGTP